MTEDDLDTNFRLLVTNILGNTTYTVKFKATPTDGKTYFSYFFCSIILILIISDGLSAGAIAGIAIGAFFGLVLIGILIFFLVRYWTNRSGVAEQES